ncbi:hypothetical protein PFISCL1PPCAC_13516, partial [Pristionchus fissidentatus]
MTSIAKQKKIYDLSKSLENALLTINKLNKRLSIIEHEKEGLAEELSWLRKFGSRADQSSDSRQSSVSIEAGDDAMRLQLRQTLHDLKLVRLESMKWKEERDLLSTQSHQKDVRITTLEKDLRTAKSRVDSLEELVRKQLGELSLADLVFNSDSVSMRSGIRTPFKKLFKNSATSSSRAVSVTSSCEKPQSRSVPVRIMSAGRNRRSDSVKADKITVDIDQLLGDLPSGLAIDREAVDATFDELTEKALPVDAGKRFHSASPRYYRSPSLATSVDCAPRHLPPLQKYKDKNVVSLPRECTNAETRIRPMTARRSILGRNASVPFMQSREPSVEDVRESANFLNIDDLLNAGETPARLRGQSGKSRDSGFTDTSMKT